MTISVRARTPRRPERDLFPVVDLSPATLNFLVGPPHYLDADARDIAEIERTGVDPLPRHTRPRFEPEVLFACRRAGEDVDSPLF